MADVERRRPGTDAATDQTPPNRTDNRQDTAREAEERDLRAAVAAADRALQMARRAGVRGPDVDRLRDVTVPLRVWLRKRQAAAAVTAALAAVEREGDRR